MATCLANGIPASERREIWTGLGHLPLRIVDLESVQKVPSITGYIVQILLEEVLGIHTKLQDPVTFSPLSTHQATYYRLHGCLPQGVTLQGNVTEDIWCDQDLVVHVVLGARLMTTRWEEWLTFHEIQKGRLGGVIENLGNMGFHSREGMFVPDAVIESAFGCAQMIGLEWYKSWHMNQTYSEKIRSYFATMDDVSGFGLVKCTKFYDNTKARMPNWQANYLALTGDREGMTGDTADDVPACHDTYWWFAPSCRDSKECIPVMVGAYSRFLEYMQKAAVWNLPWALTSGKSGAFLKILAEQKKGNLKPMPMLQQLPFLILPNMPRSSAIQFPPFVLQDYENGIRIGNQESRTLTKLANFQLAEWAPEVHHVLQQVGWTFDEVFEIYSQQGIIRFAHRNDANKMKQAACDWVQKHEVLWRAWIPRKTECLRGQGLYSEELQAFLRQRDGWNGNISCRACLPGSHSVLLRDSWGDTATCEMCPPGYSQVSFGSQECTPCASGTFSSKEGMAACELCNLGSYQEHFGATECRFCNGNGTKTTNFLGAAKEEDCICSVNTFFDGQDCRVCGKGLLCTGGHDPPMQTEGMFAEKYANTSEFSVYRCKSTTHCPAGEPGSCAPGRVGRGCGSCPVGFYSGDHGKCNVCTVSTPGAYLIILCVVILGLGALQFLKRRVRLTVKIFHILGMMVSQIIVAMQALAAILHFSLDLRDPAKTLFEFLKVFQLKVEHLRFSCVVNTESALTEYTAQLLAYPTFFAATFIAWQLGQLCRSPLVPALRHFFAFHGMITMSILTAFSLTILLPLQCVANPNGLMTMQERPEVICYQSSEHGTLVMLCVVGIFAYPVLTISWIAHCTYKFPRWLKSQNGLRKLGACQFLFGRFRPECYYYGFLQSITNLIVALVPICMVSFPALQLGLMCVVLWVRQTALCLLWPWKYPATNYHDLALSAGTLLLLNLVSPLLILNDADSSYLLSLLLTGLAIAFPLVTMFGGAIVLGRNLRRDSSFTVFLSHHKAASGALCRLLSLMLQEHMKHRQWTVFLDSDHLEEVTGLVDVVRYHCKTFVPVITQEFFQRPWCMAELTTAYKSQVPIVPLFCDGFKFRRGDMQKHLNIAVANHADAFQQNLLSMEDVANAFTHVTALPSVCVLDRKDPIKEQANSILHLVKTVQAQMTPKASWQVFTSSPRAQSEDDDLLTSSPHKATVLICRGVGVEAQSTALVLQQLVQRTLLLRVHVLQSADEIYGKASRALILLTNGVENEKVFTGMLLALQENMLSLLPVNDGSFQFPSLNDIEGAEVQQAFKDLFVTIALPFNPTGTWGILERQVEQICQRMDDLSMKHCETTQSLGATLGTTMATLTQSALPVTWSVSERGKSRKERELDVLTEKVDMCEGEEKKEKKKQDEEEQETKEDPKENRNEGNDEEEIAMYF